MRKFDVIVAPPVNGFLMMLGLLGSILTVVGFLWSVVSLFLKYVLSKDVRVKYALFTLLAGMIVMLSLGFADMYPEAKRGYDETVAGKLAPSFNFILLTASGVIMTIIGFLWSVINLSLRYIFKKEIYMKRSLITLLIGVIILGVFIADMAMNR